MVKNKALPDSARLCTPRLVTLSLSLSLADAVHPEGIPWILPRLDPSRRRFGGERIHVYAWLSHFTVHLKLG